MASQKFQDDHIQNPDTEDPSCCRRKPSDRTTQLISIAALIFYGLAVSISCSIRYGFLADSFASRGISGKVYGLVESSLIIGYVFIFLSGLPDWFMKKFDSRTLMMGIMVAFGLIQLATGLVFLVKNNLVVVVCSFLLRIIFGVFAYPAFLIPIDFINATLKDKFDFVNGLLNVGYFFGHGVAEVSGCVLYDLYGYTYAYFFSGAIAAASVIITLIAIPKTSTYLSTQDESVDDTDILEVSANLNKVKLSKILIFPMLATMLINANYGVLQVAVTPFLKEEFQKSISYGGTVLTVVSFGMSIGSFGAGLALQSKKMSTFTVMGMGALTVCVGLLMTFPPQSIPALYHLAPSLAYPGGFLAGFGDPFMTIATLRALYDIQLQVKGVLTPKVTTKLTGIWLIGYLCMYYLGSFISGALTDYLSYPSTAEILSTFCVVSMLICVGLRLRFTKRVDEEKVPLLNQH